MKFNTIHIFSYGEAQIISDEVNFKTVVSAFKNLQAVIDDVKSKKPSDVKSEDYYSINIFSDLKADYNNMQDGSFSIEYSDLDATKLSSLVDEFVTLSKK